MIIQLSRARLRETWSKVVRRRYISRLPMPNKRRLNAYGDFGGLIIDIAHQSLYDDLEVVREKGIDVYPMEVKR